MRLLRTLFWLLVAALLVTVGLANRDIVRLSALPEPLEALVGYAPSAEVPLFLAVFAGFALGLLGGFVWEWIREIPERAAAREAARELERLRAERLRPPVGASGVAREGDVLALVEPPDVPRR